VFRTSTIITIAHRIQTIADYDYVAVLDEGRLVEYGRPQVLLKDPNSAFYKLAYNTGAGGGASSGNLQALGNSPSNNELSGRNSREVKRGTITNVEEAALASKD